MKFRWFFAFFFISGFCSLVYEVIWLRLSMAKFGITTPMVSIVLSVFMAGLGLGSWLGGSFIERFRRAPAAIPLRFYGILELLIGLSAFAAPFTIDRGYDLVHGGRDLLWGSSSYYLVSGAWVALSLLPWCTCMGATFPFAMAAIRKIGGTASEHSFSFLYLANVLGAVLGTVVPAFVLIELLGFRGTLKIASAMNVLLALAVFIYSSRFTTLAGSAELAVQERLSEKAHRRREGRMLFALFFTGLCSMAMEVVWIRQFTAYLGNVVYAFAAILALYLSATFFGSWIYRRGVGIRRSAVNTVVWILLGPVALFPVLFADPRFPIAEDPLTLRGFLHGLIRAGLGICPFSAAVGFLTPMLVDRWSGGDPDSAGKAYAVNVVGSILGPLLSGFCILPWVSERWALALISIPLFLIATAVAVPCSERSLPFVRLAPRQFYAVAFAVAVLLLAFTKGIDYKYPHREELRDYTATVIATGNGMNKRLLVNGVGMTFLTPITKYMAHVPLSLLDRRPQNGLVICFGMGTTFRAMLSWGIDTTVVELVPSVPKVFGYFHADGPELVKSPLAHVVIDDGRRFLNRSQEQFDVITLDPPPPVSAPTSSLLYSEQFYALIKPHLRAGGTLQTWLPGADDATQAAVSKAIKNSFPYVRAYTSIEDWGTHFLARLDPFPPMDPKVLSQRLPPRAVADLLEWNPNSTPEKMFADLLGRGESLDDDIAQYPSAPALQDDQPVNEYFLLRSINEKDSDSD